MVRPPHRWCRVLRLSFVGHRISRAVRQAEPCWELNNTLNGHVSRVILVSCLASRGHRIRGRHLRRFWSPLVVPANAQTGRSNSCVCTEAAGTDGAGFIVARRRVCVPESAFHWCHWYVLPRVEGAPAEDENARRVRTEPGKYIDQARVCPPGGDTCGDHARPRGPVAAGEASGYAHLEPYTPVTPRTP